MPRDQKRVLKKNQAHLRLLRRRRESKIYLAASPATTTTTILHLFVCARGVQLLKPVTLYHHPFFLSVCSFGGVYHQVVHIRYHVCELIVYEQVPSPLFNFKKRKKMLAFWAHLSKTALCFGISIQRFEVIEF